MRQRCLDGDHHATDIDVDQRIDIFQRQRLQRAAAGDPGVIDQNIQPAEGLYRACDGLLNRLGVCAVGLNRRAAAAESHNLVDHRLRFIGGFFISDNHIGARLRQRQRNGAANSATGAGNQRFFTR